VGVEEAGEGVGDGGGGSSDGDGLDGAAKPASAYELSFQRAEDSEGEKGDDDGELESGEVVGDQHVREQGDEAAGNVRAGDGECGAMGSVGGWLFEAKLEAHHEVDPGGGVLLERGENGSGGGAVDRVLLEDRVDLFFFVVGALDDLALFADALGDVVLGVTTGGKVAAEAHGDGAGGDFGEAGEDDDVGGGDGSGETGGEGEGDGEAVGEADDDVAYGLGGLEVAFDVRAVAVRRFAMCDLMHGRSVVQRAANSGTSVCEGSFLGWKESFNVGRRLYEHESLGKEDGERGRMKQRLIRRWARGFLLLAAVAALPGMAAAQGGQDDQREGAAAFAGGQMVRGIVTAAGDHLTVKTETGEVYQVVVSTNTRLSRDRQPVKLTDIKVGDGVGAMGVLDAATKTVHAVFVGVLDAEQVKKAREGMGKIYITGKVTAIDRDGLRLTVMRPDGVSQVIGVDEGTSFKRGGRTMAAIVSGGVGDVGNGGAADQRVGASGSGGESITFADVKVGDSLAGRGALKNGLFVPTELGVIDAAMAQRRRQRGGDGSGAAAPVSRSRLRDSADCFLNNLSS
jgi:hypothetical protein